MATNTTLTSGQIAAQNISTSAAAVDTVTFPVDCDTIEVISNGNAELYVTVDGSTPASPYANCYRLPAGQPSVRKIGVPTSGNTVVKLLSPGVALYSVTGPV